MCTLINSVRHVQGLAALQTAVEMAMATVARFPVRNHHWRHGIKWPGRCHFHVPLLCHRPALGPALRDAVVEIWLSPVQAQSPGTSLQSLMGWG